MSREDACAATVRLQTLAIGAFALVAMLERISRSVSSGVAASMRTRFLSNAATDRMSHAHKMRGRRDRNQTFPREFVDVPVGVHAIAGEFVPFLAGAWSDRTTKRSSSLDVERKEANNAVVEGAVSTRQNRMELARWRRVLPDKSRLRKPCSGRRYPIDGCGGRGAVFPGSLWAPNAAGLHEIVISQIWRPIRSRRALAWLSLAARLGHLDL